MVLVPPLRRARRLRLDITGRDGAGRDRACGGERQRDELRVSRRSGARELAEDAREESLPPIDAMLQETQPKGYRLKSEAFGY
jgi:hypothetical protein